MPGPRVLPTQVVLRVPEEIEDALRTKMATADMETVKLSSRPPDNPLPLDEQLLELTLGEKQYPARLVNLPCVVEVHKTIDNSTLFKCGDIGQMVVVYNNDQELLEEANKEREGMAKESKAITAADKSKDKLRTSLHLDYFPSGLTPPTTNIVTRKFMMTRHEGPYPPEVVSKVQLDLQKHLLATEKSGGAGQQPQQVEVLEDIVDFEDYMVDNRWNGATFGEDSPLWREHPEIMIHRPVEFIPEPEPPPPPPPPPAPEPVVFKPPPPTEKQEKKQRDRSKTESSNRNKSGGGGGSKKAADKKPAAPAEPAKPHYVGGVRQPPWMDQVRPMGKPPPPPPGGPPPPPPPPAKAPVEGGGGGEGEPEFIVETENDDFLSWLDPMGGDDGGFDLVIGDEGVSLEEG